MTRPRLVGFSANIQRPSRTRTLVETIAGQAGAEAGAEIRLFDLLDAGTGLGAAWSRFSAPRTDMQLLGTVQHGPQIGALGRLPDGRYVQVNGDMLSPVNTLKVQAAINAAGSRPARRHAHPGLPPVFGASAAVAQAAPTSAPAGPALPVTITYRKRRTVPSAVEAV